MSSCGFYLWSHRSSYFHLGTQRFGPGDGEWLVESPDVHGLSSAKLANASALHERRLARRDCFLVVKDGVIVHEAYHNGGDADTLHYVESAGSVAAALLAGAAARHGLLDLDTPLHELGITAPPVPVPRASDPATAARERRHPELRWGSRWREVTTRHLLSQTTGWGRAPPGTTFDLDPTGDILAVVSKVLWATTGRPPAEWAREHLTGPLGAPDFFNRGGGGGDAPRGDVSVAGGQMATCRDAARFGQLIVNRGRWLAKDGSVRVLVEPEFIAEMTRLAFPRANPQYQLPRAWVHPGKDAAGNPRAGTTETTTTRERTHARNPETTSASATSTASATSWDDFAAISGDDAATRRCGDDVEGASPATRALLGADGPDFPSPSPWADSENSSCPPRRLVSWWCPWGTRGEAPPSVPRAPRTHRRRNAHQTTRRGAGTRAFRIGASRERRVRRRRRRSRVMVRGGRRRHAESSSGDAARVALRRNRQSAERGGGERERGGSERGGGGRARRGVRVRFWGETTLPRVNSARGSARRMAPTAPTAPSVPTPTAPRVPTPTAPRVPSPSPPLISPSPSPAWITTIRIVLSRDRARRSSVSAASRQKAMDDARAAQAAMLARATGSGTRPRRTIRARDTRVRVDVRARPRTASDSA